MGRFEEVARRYPEERWQVANALAALGRYQEIIEDYSDHSYPFAFSACKTGRPELALERFPEHSNVELYVKCFKALNQYFDGDRNAAVAKLSTIMDQGYDAPGNIYGHSVSRFFFYCLPLILDMNETDGLKSRKALKKMLAMVKEKYRYTGYQRFYHLLALLAGEIGERRFREQEVKQDLDFEYGIYQALEAEYQVDLLLAKQRYEKLSKSHRVRGNQSLFGEFVRRRLQELNSKK